MFIFLDVVPDKLICQPCGLSGGQCLVLKRQFMSNGKLLAALRAYHGLHNNGAGCAFLVLTQSLGDAIRLWLFCYQILTTAVRAADERDRCNRLFHRHRRHATHRRHREIRHRLHHRVPSWGVLHSR